MFNKALIPHQRPGEKILLTLRRHWFVLFKDFLLFCVSCCIPILIYLFLVYEIPSLLEKEIWYALLILVSSIYYLLIWLFMFNHFIDYYLDVWLVTNERIINIEQRNLFSRVISEKNLDRMQDITSEVKGFIPTFLNFGNIHIQTAGTQERFIFKDVPNAPEVTQEIIRIVDMYRQKYGIQILPEMKVDNKTEKII